jgi:hypothetical protein
MLRAGLRCRSWLVEVPEPASTNEAARIAAQDAYLRTNLAPWLADLDDSSHPFGQAASFHFMRYLDPGHHAGWRITFVLRFLGTAAALVPIDTEVEARLKEQRRAGAIVRYSAVAESDWDATTLPEYGGPLLGPTFAEFLAAASRLRLNGDALPVPLDGVVANWVHCFGLITSGRG